jgi:hypothetical protein
MSKRKPSRQLINLSLLLTLLPLAGWGQTQGIVNWDFGMQCGSTALTGITNCAPQNSQITLPTEPGLLRLWDSGVSWADINPNNGTTYDWGTLNEYLQAIGTDPTKPEVIYTFGYVPCWAVTGCSGGGYQSDPPSDLFNGCDPICSKSANFDTFVKALTTYCYTNSSNQTYCVKDLIKYYEMWNEADSTQYWSPPQIQGLNSADILYDLVSPEISVITGNVSGAQILTPSITGNGEGWMVNWVCEEGTNTLFSNYYDIHQYMGEVSGISITPEAAYNNVLPPGGGTLYPNYNPTPTGGCPNGKTNQWQALPWMLTETNWGWNTYLNPPQYGCTTNLQVNGGYEPDDCYGQLVRWQLLLNSPLSVNSSTVNGAANVSWYWWDNTIGDYPGGNGYYAEAYYYMQKYMMGGALTNVCTIALNSGYHVISCPFTETYTDKNGANALWVWTDDTSSSGLPFAVNTSTYPCYWDIWGSPHPFLPGGGTVTIIINYDPIMLTSTTCTPE